MKGTGKLKKWNFPEIEWDQLLELDMVPIYRFTLDYINETELVEILRIGGYRVDRSFSKKELIALLLRIGKGQSVRVRKPICDQFRHKLMYFYEVHRKIIRDQLPPYCEFKCFEHPDLMVLSCYLLDQKIIEKTWKEKKEKKNDERE